MTVSADLKAIARAVLEDDPGAALAMVDLLLESRDDPRLQPDLFDQLKKDCRPGKIRVLKMLYRANIDSMIQLLARSPGDLLERKNFGPTSLHWLMDWLARHDLKLRDSDAWLQKRGQYD